MTEERFSEEKLGILLEQLYCIEDTFVNSANGLISEMNRILDKIEKELEKGD
jgi:hypothetical protein